MKIKHPLLAGLFLGLASCSSNTITSPETTATNKKTAKVEKGLQQTRKAGDLLKKATAAPFAPQKKMTASEVTSGMGQPNYKYTTGTDEVWVYENEGRIKKELKSTALNLVPLAGPVTSMVGGLMAPKPKTPKSVVTFDANQKVVDVK